MIATNTMHRLEELSERFGVSKLSLMERAGRGVADFIASKKDVAKHVVVVFCGPGNNGGDGLVAARVLSKDAFVFVLLFAEEESLPPEAAANLARVQGDPRIAVVRLGDLGPESRERLRKQLRGQPLILLDALVGAGVHGKVRDPIAVAIIFFNSLKGFKVAVDVPSGLHPDTGEAAELMTLCNATVTFHDLKPGLKWCKGVAVVDIGIPKEAIAELKHEQAQEVVKALRITLPLAVVPKRKKNKLRPKTSSTMIAASP